MNLKASLLPVMAAFLILPRIASAAFILDTGTPTGSGGPVVLNGSQWLAGEFSATAGETITSLSAYLDNTATTGAGSTFTFDIYSGTGFLNTRGVTPVFSAAATFSADGWNTTAVDWVPTTSGNYWLALQLPAASGRNPPAFDAPLETGAGTGTVPAIAFAYAGSSGQYTLSNADPVGLEVTAVPLPASAWLFASGLLASLGTAFRRRSAAHFTAPKHL